MWVNEVVTMIIRNSRKLCGLDGSNYHKNERALKTQRQIEL